MEADLAMIFLFAGNFAPRGFASCEGQLIAISSNTALFSLLGTTYGGNGTNTFALPDLRGRVPLGQGQGPGLSPYVEGQQGGTETVTLTVNQIPSHNHSLVVTSSGANSLPGSGANFAAGNVTGSGPNASVLNFYTTAAPNVPIGPNTIGFTGGSQPHPIMQPYLGLFFVIAVEGIFPSRN